MSCFYLQNVYKISILTCPNLQLEHTEMYKLIMQKQLRKHTKIKDHHKQNLPFCKKCEAEINLAIIFSNACWEERKVAIFEFKLTLFQRSMLELFATKLIKR